MPDLRLSLYADEPDAAAPCPRDRQEPRRLFTREAKALTRRFSIVATQAMRLVCALSIVVSIGGSALAQTGTSGPPRLPAMPPPLPDIASENPPPPIADSRRIATPPPLPGARTSGPPALPRSESARDFRPSPPTLPPTSAPGAEPMQELLRLVRHDFHDKDTRGQPVEAFSMLLPDDWRVNGEVRWNGTPGTPSCLGTADAQLYLEAESPDGLWGFYIHPGAKLMWMDIRDGPPMFPGALPASAHFGAALEQMRQQARQPGSMCRVTANLTINSLVEEAYLPAVRRTWRIIGIEEMAEIRDHFDRIMRASVAPSQDMSHATFAVNYHIAFDTPSGAVEEEHLIVAWGSSMRIPTVDNTSVTEIEISGLPTFVSRFPAGRQKEARALIGSLAGTLRSSPRWDAAMAAHRAEMSRIAIDGARDRSRIWAETSQQISDIQMEGWRTRQASADRMMALTSDQIREITPMRDPQTGREYELPNDYSSFYTNPQGEILMSRDPGFRASDVFPHENWIRLEANPR